MRDDDITDLINGNILIKSYQTPGAFIDSMAQSNFRLIFFVLVSTLIF